MLWKEKKEPVLLIDPNKKKFLTINSFDDKKVKRETNSFFFLQKTPQNSLSNTLFNLSFSFREEKQNKKTSDSFIFQQSKKKCKKKALLESSPKRKGKQRWNAWVS